MGEIQGNTGMAVETKADLKTKVLEEMGGKIPKGLEKTWDAAFDEKTPLHNVVQLLKDLATAIGNGLMGAIPDRDLQKSLLEFITEKFEPKDNKTMYRQAERDLKELNRMGVKGKGWNKEPVAAAPAPIAPPAPATENKPKAPEPPPKAAEPATAAPPPAEEKDTKKADAAPDIPDIEPAIAAPAETTPSSPPPTVVAETPAPTSPPPPAEPATAHTSAPLPAPSTPPPPASPEAPGPLDRIFGTLKHAFTSAARDVAHMGGVAVDVAKHEVGMDSSATKPAATPEQDARKPGVIHPAIRARIDNFDAEDLAGPYVTGEAQLGRNVRGMVTGRINQEMQRITSGIPILGDFARSAGNNMHAKGQREAQIAEIVVKADELADKADKLRSEGRGREADAMMNRALNLADRADSTYGKVFGENSVESRHTQRAVESSVGNAVTDVLNKVQPGGLAGFIRDLGR